MLLSMCLGVKIKLEVDAKLPHQRRKNIILKRFTIITAGENQNLFEDHLCEPHVYAEKKYRKAIN